MAFLLDDTEIKLPTLALNVDTRVWTHRWFHLTSERQRDDVFTWVNILLDYLSSEESLSLTVLSHNCQSSFCFCACVCMSELKVFSWIQETSFCFQGSVAILCPWILFKAYNLSDTHSHTDACLRTYRHAHNPTITTSCGEKAAGLFLEVLLLWKIYPWHKKTARQRCCATTFTRSKMSQTVVLHCVSVLCLLNK